MFTFLLAVIVVLLLGLAGLGAVIGFAVGGWIGGIIGLILGGIFHAIAEASNA